MPSKQEGIIPGEEGVDKRPHPPAWAKIIFGLDRMLGGIFEESALSDSPGTGETVSKGMKSFLKKGEGHPEK